MIKFVPALRLEDELKTVVCVSDPPESIGFVQGRDYVVINEPEARRVYEWLGRALSTESRGADNADR